MPDDSFLWGLYRWNTEAVPSRLHFTASGELPADCIITELKQEVANDDG
jgi:hypothetical protein